MGGSRHHEASRRPSTLWRRKLGTFWGKISSITVALCVFGIVFSSSWTYRYHHRSPPMLSLKMPDEQPVHIERLPTASLADPEVVYSTPVHPAVPVLEVDGITYDAGEMPYEEDTETVVDDEIGSNMTSVFIGVLSEPTEDANFRAAARSTWVASAQALDDVQVVFFFAQQHASDPSLQQESKEFGDIVFGLGTSDMPAAYQMLEQLSLGKSARHILRVSVRSYVVVNRLLSRLETLCSRPGCAGEDIWAGRMITSRTIPPGDMPYVEETGLTMYLPYMSAGAYVLSTSLAQSLSMMHAEIGLKIFGREDVSLGVWLIPMAARRVDLGSSVHLESPCCFDAAGTMTFDICVRIVEQYPLIVSELEKPEYLKQYHRALMSCPDQVGML